MLNNYLSVFICIPICVNLCIKSRFTQKNTDEDANLHKLFNGLSI